MSSDKNKNNQYRNPNSGWGSGAPSSSSSTSQQGNGGWGEGKQSNKRYYNAPPNNQNRTDRTVIPKKKRSSSSWTTPHSNNGWNNKSSSSSSSGGFQQRANMNTSNESQKNKNTTSRKNYSSWPHANNSGNNNKNNAPVPNECFSSVIKGDNRQRSSTSNNKFGSSGVGSSTGIFKNDCNSKVKKEEGSNNNFGSSAGGSSTGIFKNNIKKEEGRSTNNNNFGSSWGGGSTGIFKNNYNSKAKKEEGPSTNKNNFGSSWGGGSTGIKKKEEETALDNDKKSLQNNTGTNASPAVGAEAWESLSWKEKILAFHPDRKYGQEIEFPCIDSLKEPTEEWEQKKENAKQVAIAKVMAEQDKLQDDNDDYDTGDSDFSDYSRMQIVGSHLEYDLQTVKKFFNALTENYLFNVGFDVVVTYANDEKNCWCPCCKKMDMWHTKFGLTNIFESGDKCERSKAVKKMEPIGLMAHLDKLGTGTNGFLHYGVKVYLQELYKDHNNGVGHKFLYKPGDLKFKAAEAAERKISVRAHQKLAQELEEERKQRMEEKRQKEAEAEKNKQLLHVNKEYFKEIQAMKKKREILGIKQEDILKKENLDNEAMEEYFDLYRGFFDTVKCVVMAHTTDAESACLKAKGNFNLQDWFDEGHTKKKDDTFLFKTHMGDRMQWRLFKDWNVVFDTDVKVKGNKKGMMAVDEGGPTTSLSLNLVNVWVSWQL